MIVKIKKSLLEKIFLDTEKCYPYEACGILAGESNNEKIVERIYSIKNICQSSVAYEMDPEEIYQTLKQIENDNLALLGFYHSHPLGGSGYSLIDEKKSELWKGHLYFIVSLENRKFACYLKNESLHELEVIIMT